MCPALVLIVLLRVHCYRTVYGIKYCIDVRQITSENNYKSRVDLRFICVVSLSDILGTTSQNFEPNKTGTFCFRFCARHNARELSSLLGIYKII